MRDYRIQEVTEGLAWLCQYDTAYEWDMAWHTRIEMDHVHTKDIVADVATILLNGIEDPNQYYLKYVN